jgi:hypothetical protein
MKGPARPSLASSSQVLYISETSLGDDIITELVNVVK